MSFLRAIVCTVAVFTFLAVPLLVEAQQRPAQERRASDPPVLRRSLRGVLGGVPMTATDSMHQEVVRRLDFESYKSILYGDSFPQGWPSAGGTDISAPTINSLN